MVQAWTIAGKYKKRADSLGPGPGQYTSRNTDAFKMKSPQWTIGTAQKGAFNTRTLSPGPGVYNTIKDANDAPKYHFGSKSVTDFDKFKKSVPGPGQYDPKNSGFNKTAFSFAGRHDLQNKDHLSKPGPGAYSSGSTLSKSMGKFGTSPK